MGKQALSKKEERARMKDQEAAWNALEATLRRRGFEPEQLRKFDVGSFNEEALPGYFVQSRLFALVETCPVEGERRLILFTRRGMTTYTCRFSQKGQGFRLEGEANIRWLSDKGMPRHYGSLELFARCYLDTIIKRTRRVDRQPNDHIQLNLSNALPEAV